MERESEHLREPEPAPFQVAGRDSELEIEPVGVVGQIEIGARFNDQFHPACSFHIDANFLRRLSTLNAIAQLRNAAGSLDRIRRVFRLEGTLNVAEGYDTDLIGIAETILAEDDFVR